MNRHLLKIKQHYIEQIKLGLKTHEYRLATPERKKISIGDRLLLRSNQDINEIITVTVTGINVYSSWEEALKDKWESDFKKLFNSLDGVMKECGKFYKNDDVKKYGIIRFDIEYLKPKLRNNRVLLDTNIIIDRESHNNTTFEITKAFKWMDKLHSTKLIDPNTEIEIKKYNNESIRNNVCIKLEAYERLIPREIDDDYFSSIVKNFSMNDNSIIDNEILYQVYDGLSDLLITNDRIILKKAELLGIKNIVFSCDEYLKALEEEFPEKIDYKMLSVKKTKFGNVDIKDSFFDSLKLNYLNFEQWYNSKNSEEAYVFKEEGKVYGFLYVKVEFDDEKDYSLINPKLDKKKRLKVGTFKIDNKVRGFRLSERFLKIIFDNAIANKVQEIYVTLYENVDSSIDKLAQILKKWGFVYWGTKSSSDGRKETVLVKTLEKYNEKMGVQFNFPLLKPNPKLFYLPIDSKYHTELFPDSILKNENMSLYSDKKGHLYALEKIYVSNTFKNDPKPGDLLVIYRTGDRLPKKYSSVCTGICVLKEIIKPLSEREYLNACSNKSIFRKDELIKFYREKNYKTVIKLILYQSFEDKILLDELYKINELSEPNGPRTFDSIKKENYNYFLRKGGK